VQIKTVFLDAGGVLVDPNWQRVSAVLRRHGIDVEPEALSDAEAHAKFRFDEPVRIATTRDEDRWDAYFEHVLTQAGVRTKSGIAEAMTELRAYHAAHNLWEHVPSQVPDVLGRLRSRGLQLVVVSNANEQLRASFDRLGLSQHIDILVNSYEEGVGKPDPRLFQIALDRATAQPDSTVHVGDLYHVDVVGARAAGVRAVLLDPADLHTGYDCGRIRRLHDLVELLAP
jgi:putative hydrolase of the HAD superfamily